MRQINLEFSYKGDRNYVHGTDIYKQIIKTLNAIGYDNWQYFELNIKKISHYNLTCFLSDTKQKQVEEVVNFRLVKDGKELYGSLIENSDKEIVTRYSFDEKDITNHCIIDPEQKNITYRNLQNTQTIIEIIISMSKFYLENAVDNSVKWFYRTTKFIKPIDDIKFQQISIKEVLRKRTFVGFNIIINDQIVGYAYGVSI